MLVALGRVAGLLAAATFLLVLLASLYCLLLFLRQLSNELCLLGGHVRKRHIHPVYVQLHCIRNLFLLQRVL